MSPDSVSRSPRVSLVDGAGQLLERIDHSATSNKKYAKLEYKFANILGVQPSAIYTTYVSKAGNVRVRLSQSSRARIATVLVVLVSAQDAKDAEGAIRTLVKFHAAERPDSEILVLERSGKDSNDWSATLALFTKRNAEPAIAKLVSSWSSLSKVAPNRQVLEVSDQLQLDGHALQIISTATQLSRKLNLSYPLAMLEYQQWDDHGFRSTFAAKLYLSPANYRTLGNVKILSTSQTQGITELPKRVVSVLPETHYSIGQDFDYYLQLDGLPASLKHDYLRAMRDITRLDEDALRHVQTHSGFDDSLLRSATAENIAIKSGAGKMTGAKNEVVGSFSYIPPIKHSGGKYDTAINFSFLSDGYLPGRINALIGYNGVGKSRTLSSLAILAATETSERLRLADGHGRLESENYRYSSVFAVSYSAFDNFEHPSTSAGEYSLGSDTYTYTYCGIRKVRDGSPQPELKGHQELVQEYAVSLDKIIAATERSLLLTQCTDLLRTEPSIARSSISSLSDSKWVSVDDFALASSGHKAVFHSLVLLVANLQPTSLVLVDEPESHMHPSLLAMWLRVLGHILENRDSHAIIATHSPVIIQELPARGVRVLERIGDRHYSSSLPEESFGENLGRIVSSVFHLDATGTDYHQVLRRMALEMSLEDADLLFGRGMSNQARAFFIAIQRSQNRPAQ